MKVGMGSQMQIAVEMLTTDVIENIFNESVMMLKMASIFRKKLFLYLLGAIPPFFY